VTAGLRNELEKRNDIVLTTDESILTTEITKPKHIEVDSVVFSTHSKLGSPDAMRVTYEALPRNYSQWILFEHKGYARQKAKSWWMRGGGKSPIPKTVAEALERAPVELRKIVGIDVRTIGKYPEVIKLHFGEGVKEQPAAAPKRTTTNAA
jgi:DNA repair protein RadD